MKPLIHPNARVAPNVRLGAGVRIHANVEIQDGCEIGDFCVIGHPAKTQPHAGHSLVLGAGALIRSHTILYEGSTLGAGLETGHHVVIREGTVAGTNLRVGNFSDLEGACEIGDYCRFHGYVHVGRGSRIGNFVWLFSLVTLTNDPLPPSFASEPVVLEDGVVIAVNVTVMPGAHLRRGAYVTSGGSVKGEVPAGAVVKDGKVVCDVHALMNMKHGIRHPWMNHFADAYPETARDRVVALGAVIKADALLLRAVPRAATSA